MYSKVKIAGHPLHAMLVPFPVAFYSATFACYLTYYLNGNVFWFKVAILSNCAGVLMAIVAALPGFIDWLGIPNEKKGKRIGVIHMVFNLIALLFFGLNAIIQYPKWDHMAPGGPLLPCILSGAGVLCTFIAGFLGWSLVQKHHVGISLTKEQERLEPLGGVKNK